MVFWVWSAFSINLLGGKVKFLAQLPSLDIPLFSSGRLHLCLNIKDWKECHSELGAEPQMLDRCGAANTFRHISGGRDVYLLGVFDGRVSTLAHEAAHIVFDICRSVGVEVEAGKANETFCYLLDVIVSFASEHMKEPTDATL